MPRINLMGTAEPTSRGGMFGGGAEPGLPEEPSERSGQLLAILILGGTLAFIGYQYWSASQAIAKLDEDIASLNQEKAKLQTIIQQVEAYEKQLELLKQKEELIHRLMSEREGPVRMLDELSAQLPDFIWLESLNQSSSGVSVSGKAASYVSIADYIRKLEDTDIFQNVELIDAKQEKEFTSFSLRSRVVTPKLPGETAEAAQAGGR